ncbi:MAG: L,D-transpeptidase family protein [Syntrophobacteraceae bacterium]
MIFPSKRGWLFAGVSLFAFVALSHPAFSETGERPRQVRPAPVEGTLHAAPEKATSALWRSHIWEVFPADRIGGVQSDPVSEAYQQNDWRPFFIDSQFDLNERAKLVINRLGSLRDEAIDPQPYKLDELNNAADKLTRSRAALKALVPAPKDTAADALLAEPPPSPAPAQAANGGVRAPAPSPTPEQILAERNRKIERYQDTFKAAAELDVSLAAAFALYAREMNPFAGEELVKALSGEIPAAKMLKDFEPASPHYHVLIAAYARYRELAETASQQRYGGSGSLRPGQSGNHVRDLQKRLQQEGFYSGHITGVYDAETQKGVKAFQAMHLVEPDGVVGRGTTDWLNVSFREKAEMIALAMKAMRQSSTRKHERFVRINIPQFMLEYHKDGKIEETHRVVVGKATGKKVKFRGRLVGENQTPTLAGAIEQVILNPRWYVSDRIRLELNSEAKSDPEWFARHGYVQMASAYPWGEPRIFQRPGPNNALGRVKFEFPNVYAVYLHDTPKKHLFQRTRRDFSHGCIRVDKALQLAETLLNDDKNPYAQKIAPILGGQNQTFVRLSQPVPILIEYVPVSSNGNGQVLFLGDPYGILKEERIMSSQR